MINRERLSSAVIVQAAGPSYEIQITMDLDTRPRFVIRCNDLPTARSIVDAVAKASSLMLDLTGRCTF